MNMMFYAVTHFSLFMMIFHSPKRFMNLSTLLAITIECLSPHNTQFVFTR